MLDLAAQFKLDAAFKILNVCFKTLWNDDAGAGLKGTHVQVHRRGNWRGPESGSSNTTTTDNGSFSSQAVVEEKGRLVFASLQTVDDGERCGCVTLKQGNSWSYAMEACHS